MSILVNCGIIFIALSLAGCQILPVANFYSNNNLAFAASSSFGRSLQIEQKLTLGSGDSQVVIPIAVNINKRRYSLVGFSPLGGVLFSAKLEGNQVTAYKADYFPFPLSPKRLLTQHQWAIWPLSSLQAELRDSSLEVKEDNQQRLLKYNDNVIARITYTHKPGYVGRIVFYDFLSQTSWEAETVSQQ